MIDWPEPLTSRHPVKCTCRHPALWVLAPELDPAALWQGWPWDTEAKSAAGAVAEHCGARPRGKRAPLPPGRAPDHAARPLVRCRAWRLLVASFQQ